MPSANRNISDEEIERAGALLKAGGVVVFPMDTVYGVGADASNEGAVARIYAVKGRPADRPLQLSLADPEDLQRVAADLSRDALSLARRFLPGPLTLVVRRAGTVAATVAAGGGTIGVRVPDHAVPLRLARLVGPLAVTSANVSGQPAPITAEEASRQIGHRVDLVLDGGPCPLAGESTVVDVTVSPPRIVRQGVLSREALERALGTSIPASAAE